ncbi:hypothetical protein [Pseudoroseomonas cervicalis]|uniref:hypothetical protein n=1 Tax=Teichococcus cervicalis TaxID=204525 RepID=UPI002781F0FE|nr:hypothetical protein [Pseudoroseomonas cervicalis]MDQ1081420.1 hypothetical protein [Pseudoroseomonas cervicalis]
MDSASEAPAPARPLSAAPALPSIGGALGGDARLVSLCAEYTRALDAYNGKAAWLGPDGAPMGMSPDDLEALVDGIEEELQGLRATTLEGLAAKARVAAHQAKQPGGIDFGEGVVGDWPEQVIRDLLRMAGEPELPPRLIP